MVDKKRHPIQVVARRTGLTPEVLRVWEKRYQVVEPARTETGRRVYSDADVARLQLMRRAILCGRRVGEVSQLSTRSLEALALEDKRALQEVSALGPESGGARGDAGSSRHAQDEVDPQTASPFVEECMRAVRDLDAPRLEEILNRTLMTQGSAAFGDMILDPLLRTIGEQWNSGRLDPYSEHFATGVIRQMTSRMFFWPEADHSAPVAIVTTPAGQRHEIGAILVACVARTEGWRVVFLGPDLPARDIARAAEQAKADVVALSIVYPADDPGLKAEISDLHRRLRKGISLLVGGAAAPSYSRLLRRIGAEIIPDFEGLRVVLRRIRADGPARREGEA